MNIADGTYAAKPGAASVYESEKGALVLAVQMKIADGPELRSYHTLVLADGTINTRTVENLKAWSGWDGADPYWFMDQDLSAVDVEVVVANEPGFQDPSKSFPKIKWVNPPGGSSGGGMPEAADRRAVLAKYGAKFRALAGGAPVRPATAAPAAPPVRPAATAAPTQPTLPRRDLMPPPAARPRPNAPAVANQASAWHALCELGKAMDQAQREAIWFDAVDATGMDQATMTPEGWAKVQAAIIERFKQPAAEPVADSDPMPF